MSSRACVRVALAWSLVCVYGCGSDARPPASPGSPSPGPTLTLSAPVAVSPIAGAVANSLSPALVLRAATGSDVNAVVSYEIQILAANDEVAYTRTVPGGPANGQSSVSHQVDATLARWRTYRWRARAVSDSTTSLWSDATSGSATFLTTRPDASSSNDEFREFFFDLVAQRNVGPNATQQGLASMEADLTGAGVILAKADSGAVRGRLYLPTGGANKYARSVDVVTGFGPGFPWVWIFRGVTVCEGICP